MLLIRGHDTTNPYDSAFPYDTGGAVTVAAIYEIQYSLNVLANTVSGLTTFQLDAQRAANVYAGTTGLDLVYALNKKNGTTGLDFQKVCNALNGTTTKDAQDALSQLAGGGHTGAV